MRFLSMKGFSIHSPLTSVGPFGGVKGGEVCVCVPGQCAFKVEILTSGIPIHQVLKLHLEDPPVTFKNYENEV